MINNKMYIIVKNTLPGKKKTSFLLWWDYGFSFWRQNDSETQDAHG
jgi:hypothetical protein